MNATHWTLFLGAVGMVAGFVTLVYVIALGLLALARWAWLAARRRVLRAQVLRRARRELTHYRGTVYGRRRPSPWPRTLRARLDPATDRAVQLLAQDYDRYRSGAGLPGERDYRAEAGR